MKSSGKRRKPVLLSAIGLAVLALSLTACPPAPVAGNVTLGIQATLPAGPLASVLPGPAARSLAASRAAGDPIVLALADGSLSITTAKVVLKEFEIEKEGVDGDGVNFEYEGPYLVDLVAGSVTPSLGAIDLAPGSYDELKFKIDKIEGDETGETGAQLVADTDPLFGKSILLEGSFTPTGDTAIPFSYAFETDAEFELKGAGDTAVAFTVTDTDVNAIIVAFRLAKWFDGIVMADFVADPALFAEALKENIRISADYGKDDDEDGVLSSAEDDDPDSEDAGDD